MDPIECSVCGGDVGLLGVLGKHGHFMCRNCGMQSSRVLTYDELAAIAEEECPMGEEECLENS